MMQDSRRRWTFFTNHGHVLIYLSRLPDARVRDIADDIGITERATHAILRDLIDAGYATVAKVGRRNTYSIDHELTFRHRVEAEHTVGEILRVFLSDRQALSVDGDGAGQRKERPAGR